MAGIFQRLKGIFGGGQPEPALSLEELRTAFKTKYHAFKLLLNANNTALQLMTDMEAALHGNQSFGMTFIRSHCTAACVNVYSLIRSLNELFLAHNGLQEEINRRRQALERHEISDLHRASSEI